MNSSLLNERIALNENANNEMEYGILKGTTTGCSFLNKENLCGLQLEHGHESLCYSCRSYPRINNLLGYEVERSLAMSCPETVGILCSLEGGLDFEIIEDNSHYNVKKYIDSDIADLVFTIRLICIQLMQDRNFSIEKRLERIGYFINDFTSLSSNEQLLYLQGEYEVYLNKLESVKYKNVNKIKKIKITKELVEYMWEKGNVNKRYKLATGGFSGNFPGTDEELLIVYNQVEQKYLEYMQNYDYQLENVLVNLMFQEIFPFDNENIIESYCILLFRFGIIKSKILNIAVKDDLTVDNISLIIQTYFKALDHYSYIKNMYKIFYKGESNLTKVMHDFLS